MAEVSGALQNAIYTFTAPCIGLYLITSIISPWLKAASKKELQIVLGLWGITLLFPLLEQWLKISTSEKAPFYLLSESIGGSANHSLFFGFRKTFQGSFCKELFGSFCDKTEQSDIRSLFGAHLLYKIPAK